MKAVKEELSKSNPDAVAEFEKGAAAFAKKVVGNFKDYEFVSTVIRHRVNQSYVLVVHRRVHEPRRHGRFIKLSRKCTNILQHSRAHWLMKRMLSGGWCHP